MNRSEHKKARNVVLAAFYALLFAACGAREDPKFRSDLDEFVKKGSILNSYTAQGVSYQTFADQLARTSAAFDILSESWPKDRLQSARIGFSKAVYVWSVTLKVWKRQLRGEKYLLYAGDDLNQINEVLEAMERMPVAQGTREDEKAYLKTMVSEMMSYASEKFETGRKELSAK